MKIFKNPIEGIRWGGGTSNRFAVSVNQMKQTVV